MPRLVLAVALGCLLVGSVAVLATGEWHLECTQRGLTIGGTDCLQALPGSIRTEAEPAQTLGWLAPSTAAAGAAIGLALLVRRGRHGPAARSADR